MMFSTIGESPTIYTNVHATLTSLVKKYLSKSSVRQNKVRTLFDPESCPVDSENLPTAISSEGVPTPPIVSLRSLRPDRL